MSMMPFCAALVMLLLAAAVCNAEDNACLVGSACQPWQPTTTCVVGNRMDVRFVLEEWPADGEDIEDYVTYSFCPLVDQNQAYVLEGSVGYANNSFTAPAASSLNQTHIMVYGQGSADVDLTIPYDGFGRAVYSYAFPSGNSPFGTGCAPGQTAVVSFLIINFTMTNGDYQYQHNGTVHHGEPINSGWVPTCDSSNKCLFGDAACIGEGNLMNCARCYENQAAMGVASTKIWAAYYGSDQNGRTFVSGQSNPLNFLQYASESAYTTMANSL